MTQRVKDLIDKINKECKVNENDLRYAIHELSHTILAVGKGHILIKLELKKLMPGYDNTKIKYNDEGIIYALQHNLLENIIPNQIDKYINIANSYLEILAAGLVSEEIFFDMCVDYTKVNDHMTKPKNPTDFDNYISFGYESDGYFFHKLISNIDLSIIPIRIKPNVVITKVRQYLYSADFNNILIILLEEIFFSDGRCKGYNYTNNIDMNWINKTIQDNYII